MLGPPGLRVLSSDATRLAVWGDPIAHSRSPQLHAAAYRVLDLEWSYERRRVDMATFPEVLASLDHGWRGLSLTMPLKAAAFAAARTRDGRARLTGAVNTLLLTADGPHGFNTDVPGIVDALGDEGVTSVGTARIVGAGATATSALVALAELGSHHVQIVARRPEAIAELVAMGEEVGVTVAAAAWDEPRLDDVAVTIATLPGGAQVTDAAADALAAHGGFLLDAVYGHWPTALGAAWDRTGRPAASGLGMLLRQALVQVRIFVAGDPDVPLGDEDAVLAAMRDAAMGD
ncbi:shikimate dehydrogenase [Microbacterium deminutum]|uniref:shikimate dehydrogenase n=1 Tax=Microbacterium deminutum TaxID=344164 RepID=UPI0031DC2D7D